MHLKLFTSAGLLVCASIAVILLQSSSARPALHAGRTPSLKRVKRTLGCVEVTLSGEAISEWKNAPKEVSLAAAQLTSDTLKPSYFVRVGWEGVAKGRGDGVRVCRGWMEGGKLGNGALLVKDGSLKVQYIVFPSRPSLSHSLTVWFTCADSSPVCFHILSEGSKSLVRRDVQDNHSPGSRSSHSSDGSGRGVRWGVGVFLTVAGLIGILASLAMCAHESQTYEPDILNTKTSEVAFTNEPSAVKSDSLVNLLNTESSSQDVNLSETTKSVSTSVASSEGGSKQLSLQQSGSQDPLIQSGNETREVRSKNLTSSGMPMLETAESPRADEEKDGKVGDEGEYASVNKQEGETGEYDYVDKVVVDEVADPDQQDETGYAYATVGGAVGEGPVRAAKPDKEDGGNKGDEQENRDRGSDLPPYGKVTRHMVPISKKGRYSEVVTSPSPILPPGRPRAVTEPIDPSQTDHKGEMREDRLGSESAAHLPLPQIPKLEVSEEMYDSIPDELRESAATPADSGGSGGASASVAKPKNIRESLYESVEEAKEEVTAEGEEDMYESVPEDIRQPGPTPSSPVTLSPTSPLPPAPRSPGISRVKSEIPVASSPGISRVKSEIPVASSPTMFREDHDDGKRQGREHVAARDAKSELRKHKVLSKAKSDTGAESRGRSLSSFFSRKKAGTPASPKHKKEKDQQEPLPRVPTEGSVTSPTHLPSSPPPIPAPPPPDEDEDEDYPPDSAYDMIDVINPRGAALLSRNNASAKDRSASLPASMRTAGASVFHPVDHGPLPDVPEESAGGLVARQRVKEDMDPEYDTVVLEQLQQDEPSYDSVEIAREVDAMPKLEPAEPIAAEADPGRGKTPSNRYAKVLSHTSADTVTTQDLSALSPDHDSLGYAVIPAHLKIRKRAKSDALKLEKEQVESTAGKTARRRSAEWDDPGYDKITPSQAAAETDNLLNPSPPMEPEYESVTDAMKEKQEKETADNAAEVEAPYASVDMAAKRRSQMLRQMSGGAHTLDTDAATVPLHEHSPSPNPPPLPQQGDLGDLAEFQQPPIPDQSNEALQLIEPDELQLPAPRGIVNPYSQIDMLVDPPYASIKKKSENEEPSEGFRSEGAGEDENPYATVDNLSEETSVASTNDPPYAKIKRGKVVGDDTSECTSESVTTSGAAEGCVNGNHIDGREDEEDDTYDRLDHGFGNAATCRANTTISPSGQNECSTMTLDFSTSPVSQTHGTSSEVNGIVRHVEEKTIDFAD